MELKFIGTGSIDAFQSSASYLIDKEILIDIPNGSVKKIKQLGENILNIKVIMITHLHGDHFADIPFFMFEKYFKKDKNETKIYCPRGTHDKVKQLFEVIFPEDYDKLIQEINIKFIEFDELKNQELLNNIYVDSIKVEHGNCKPAYGYVIKQGEKSIGFSGDSKMCEAIEHIVSKSNISVLDMSTEIGNDAHMGINNIEEICKEHTEKKIIATHIHDRTREIAKSKNISNLIIPDDGQTINI